MQELIKRLKNTGTLVSVACTIALILNQFGLKVDVEWVNVTINLVCVLGVALGVLNNPTTPKIDNPFKEVK